jgi:hypothetical protein
MAAEFNPRCETCVFFRARKGAAIGECRRNAPATGPARLAAWPRVRKDDSCGEYDEAAE